MFNGKRDLVMRPLFFLSVTRKLAIRKENLASSAFPTVLPT